MWGQPVSMVGSPGIAEIRIQDDRHCLLLMCTHPVPHSLAVCAVQSYSANVGEGF